MKQYGAAVCMAILGLAACGSGGRNGAATSTTKLKTTSTTASAVSTGTCGPGDATCNTCPSGRVWSRVEGCTFTGAPVSADNPTPTADSTRGCAGLWKFDSSGWTDAGAITFAEADFGFDPAWQAAMAGPKAAGFEQLRSFMMVTVKAWCQGHDAFHA